MYRFYMLSKTTQLDSVQFASHDKQILLLYNSMSQDA